VIIKEANHSYAFNMYVSAHVYVIVVLIQTVSETNFIVDVTNAHEMQFGAKGCNQNHC